jgi:hypothetical protein
LDGNIHHVVNGSVIKTYDCAEKGGKKKRPTVDSVLYCKVQDNPALLASVNDKRLLWFAKTKSGYELNVKFDLKLSAPARAMDMSNDGMLAVGMKNGSIEVLNSNNANTWNE